MKEKCRENISEREIFSSKNVALYISWDAPHRWLHHGVHPLADMKAAISDNLFTFKILWWREGESNPRRFCILPLS